jgi:hypothetical protein
MHVASVFLKCFSCFIWMLHILQWLYTYVASVSSKYFTYFRRMLQAFYLDVVYVVVVIHICCKHMFQLFHQVSVCCGRCSDSRACTRCTHPSSTTMLCGPAPIVGHTRNGQSVPKWASTLKSKCMCACRVSERASTQRTHNHAPLHHKAWSR